MSLGASTGFSDGSRASAPPDSKRAMSCALESDGSAAAPTAGLHFTDEVLAEEKKIALALMDQDPKMAGKPEAVKEKIVMGKMNKFYEENCLLQQEFVKDGSLTVEKYIASAAKALGGSVKFVDAVRFQKGEGIEKKEENFAEEVAAQMNMGKK